MKVRVRAGGRETEVDLERPVSLAIEIAFAQDGLHYFGAPGARSVALATPGFAGRVAAGASCNCSTLTLTPHGNGTHTECAGHLTVEPLDAFRVVPAGLILARLVTVVPERAPESPESGAPEVRSGDRLVTRAALEAAGPHDPATRALAVRTLPNGADKRERGYADGAAPYLSPEAARWLVERGIEHLVVDLPSIDRLDDGGRLSAHRLFFGLPPGSKDLGSAQRAHCTVTELAYVPDGVADGPCLLEIQVPALAGDAVPSRPLLYPLDGGT